MKLVEKQKKPVLKMKDDIMFKAFFSRKENEGFLKDLLEAILGKKIKIKRVIHDARLEQMEPGMKYNKTNKSMDSISRHGEEGTSRNGEKKVNI